MNNTINTLNINKNLNISNYIVNTQYLRRINTPAVLKQEIWRQKQIKKYYIDGRPLFGAPKNHFLY